jgi:hypothetical protein
VDGLLAHTGEVMNTGFAHPDVVGQRELSAAALCDSVQSHPMKMHLFGGTIALVGNLAGNFRRVRMSMLSQHHGKRINHAVQFRLHLSFHTTQPLAAEGLKSLPQEIEPITKGLITRQLWKPRLPIIDGQLVNGFLLKQAVEMTEEEDRD